MIPLRLKIDPLPIEQPLVVRLNGPRDANAAPETGRDAYLISASEGGAEYDLNGFSMRLHDVDAAELDGDVVMIPPGRGTVHRLIRAKSRHNTLLVTEQCDQKCIICSQPPKAEHIDLFQAFLEAVCLAPREAMIGISGGEPTLHKERLREFLFAAHAARPDLSFHILTNGQHFDEGDLGWLRQLRREQIIWGVPIYSAEPEVHDKIVAKPGAFARLERGLSILARAGAAIELRTVPMVSNAQGFPALVQYVTTRLPFIHVWAIMQMEHIGYARLNWDQEFFDSSTDFAPIAEALDLAEARGVPATLYNFPLCTVPPAYRAFCARSISDWKQKYLTSCEGCSAQASCCGFFEWYPDQRGFKGVARQ